MGITRDKKTCNVRVDRCRRRSIGVLQPLRDGFALSGVPTGLGPGDFPRVFVRYARGAVASPCRGKVIERRLLDSNYASRYCHRIGRPRRLTSLASKRGGHCASRSGTSGQERHQRSSIIRTRAGLMVSRPRESRCGTATHGPIQIPNGHPVSRTPTPSRRRRGPLLP
jgi:hypothetical protein